MSKPDLTLKNPSRLKKVEILEETVKTGTLEDLKAVLDTYQPFELTARALGLAARYRGLDFVRMLVEHGASFDFNDDPSLQSKYKMRHIMRQGSSYRTEYYLMLIPEKLDLTAPSLLEGHTYHYTPMFGISYMGITEELEETVLPLDQRIEIMRYISREKRLDVSLDDMLFWALPRGELDFADALIAMGASLTSRPTYYSAPWRYRIDYYMETITTGKQSVYWNGYVTAMGELKAEQVLPVLERLHALANAAGKKLAMSQKLFDRMDWTDEALAFAMENMDISRINRKNALETAADINAVAALGKMAEACWLDQRRNREELIAYAMEHERREALAWLMDFKNRTVDIAAEEAMEEAKRMKELSASPDSVAAMKKIWGYKKLEDGTLMITSYKGNDTEIVVPNRIGKAEVTAIRQNVFHADAPRLNKTRKKVLAAITSVEFPGTIREIPKRMFCIGWQGSPIKRVVLNEGIKRIGDEAFGFCTEIESIYIPDSVRKIGSYAFGGCRRLKEVRLPKGIRSLPNGMLNKTGIKTFDIPNSVKTIGNGAFNACQNLTFVSFPIKLKRIGNRAFFECPVEEIVLPETLTEIGRAAFSRCKALRSVSVPKTTILGEEVFFGCSALSDEKGQIIVNGVLFDTGWPWKDGLKPLVIGREIEAVNINREMLPRIVYRECSDDAPVPDVSKVSVGDLVSFGRFPDKEDYVMRPLQWRVLAVEDGKALMITEKEIIRLNHHLTWNGVWANSPVRKLLNNGFYEASFSEKERAHILLSDIITTGDKKRGTEGGPDSKDWAFLLSLEEVEKYIPTKEGRRSAPTAYAYVQGEPAKRDTGCWLLRTLGRKGEGPIVVTDDYGDFSYGWAYREYIRPAVWIR